METRLMLSRALPVERSRPLSIAGTKLAVTPFDPMDSDTIEIAPAAQRAPKTVKIPASARRPVPAANPRPRRPGVGAGAVKNDTIQPAQFEIAGPWTLRVTTEIAGSVQSRYVDVPVPETVHVVDERYANLPVFDDAAFGWTKGLRLAGVSAQEGVVPGILVPNSVEVVIEGVHEPLIEGVDFLVDPYWGTIGRTDSGRLTETDAVIVRYAYVPPRVDTVVLLPDGQIVFRAGTPSTESARSPEVVPGEKILGRIYRLGPMQALSSANLYPVLSQEGAGPQQGRMAARGGSLQSVLRKLKNGREVRILAWGDSVTEGRFLTNPEAQRWQEQFVARLKQLYPKARITLMTEAWPGHGSADYLSAPADHPKNFERAVLGVRPDLVISEFVNDAYSTSSETIRRYERILGRFRGAGIEWIVMTPHFTHPVFMGFQGGGAADHDPRPYVAGVKAFAARSRVPIADVSALWADLVRQGMPYPPLLSNGINHPTAEGLKLYADALMALFAK